jgi:hypothetical protein
VKTMKFDVLLFALALVGPSTASCAAVEPTGETQEAKTDHRAQSLRKIDANDVSVITIAGHRIELPLDLPEHVIEGSLEVLVHDINRDELPDIFIRVSEAATGPCYALLVQIDDPKYSYSKHSDEFCNPDIDAANGTVVSVEREGPYSNLHWYETTSAGVLVLRAFEEVIDYDYSRHVVQDDAGVPVASRVIFRGLPQCGSAYARTARDAALLLLPEESSIPVLALAANETVQILEIQSRAELSWAKVRSETGNTGWIPQAILNLDEQRLRSTCKI